MRVCDICKENGKFVLALHYCPCCSKDICAEHTIWFDGSPYCPDCDSDGESNCPICELPYSMCSCKSVSPKVAQKEKTT